MIEVTARGGGQESAVGRADSCVREFWVSNLVRNVAAVSQAPGLSEFLIHCILRLA